MPPVGRADSEPSPPLPPQTMTLPPPPPGGRSPFPHPIVLHFLRTPASLGLKYVCTIVHALYILSLSLKHYLKNKWKNHLPLLKIILQLFLKNNSWLFVTKKNKKKVWMDLKKRNSKLMRNFLIQFINIAKYASMTKKNGVVESNKTI